MSSIWKKYWIFFFGFEFNLFKFNTLILLSFSTIPFSSSDKWVMYMVNIHFCMTINLKEKLSLYTLFLAVVSNNDNGYDNQKDYGWLYPKQKVVMILSMNIFCFSYLILVFFPFHFIFLVYVLHNRFQSSSSSSS